MLSISSHRVFTTLLVVVIGILCVVKWDDSLKFIISRVLVAELVIQSVINYDITSNIDENIEFVRIRLELLHLTKVLNRIILFLLVVCVAILCRMECFVYVIIGYFSYLWYLVAMLVFMSVFSSKLEEEHKFSLGNYYMSLEIIHNIKYFITLFAILSGLLCFIDVFYILFGYFSLDAWYLSYLNQVYGLLMIVVCLGLQYAVSMVKLHENLASIWTILINIARYVCRKVLEMIRLLLHLDISVQELDYIIYDSVINMVNVISAIKHYSRRNQSLLFYGLRANPSSNEKDRILRCGFLEINMAQRLGGGDQAQVLQCIDRLNNGGYAVKCAVKYEDKISLREEFEAYKVIQENSDCSLNYCFPNMCLLLDGSVLASHQKGTGVRRSECGLMLVLSAERKALFRHMCEHPKSLSGPTTCIIGYQLVKGLKYLHSLGFIHRDIKYENTLISRDCKHVKLCDLGLASRIVDEKGEIAPQQHNLLDIQQKGNEIFGSISTLNGSSPSFSSDIESVCQLLLDMNDIKLLPWTNTRYNLRADCSDVKDVFLLDSMNSITTGTTTLTSLQIMLLKLWSDMRALPYGTMPDHDTILTNFESIYNSLETRPMPVYSEQWEFSTRGQSESHNNQQPNYIVHGFIVVFGIFVFVYVAKAFTT